MCLEFVVGEIYLIRHGQTAWNKARMFRGRRDVCLNDVGRREAACVAQALRDIAFARIYASPLLRARETADVAAAVRGVDVQADPAFVDIDYGEWTEYWDIEARRKFREQYEIWETAPHLMKFPGGESLEDVRSRAFPRLLELAGACRNGPIGIVSHRVVLKVLVCKTKGWDDSRFWEVRLDTGGISKLEFDSGRLRVVVENETQHLTALDEHDSVDF